ncbi:LysR substrate-binding domain-containing protein [Bradyrhizobium sp. STM 3562]|uniref:LysR substrate-binding domain-containing protein n=1 Tax=Bradyrhizobium sp. STM 3562 TaxID=578924 RepID=UPI00388DF2D3
MSGIQLAELMAFTAVAEHLSFTKAAHQVGIALPTMSQTIRSLEERLGVRLFNRTTRSVALTEAGERLLGEIQPVIAGLDHALESVNLFRDKPIGTLRLAVSRPSSMRRLAPLLRPFLAEYPAIRLDIAVDDTHGDIVGGRFDAGIRVGQRVERDMTALRLGDDFRMMVVAAPSYLAHHPKPAVPRDLLNHNCLRYRAPWEGAIQPWIFCKGRQKKEVSVEGSLTVNDIELLVAAALDGVGIAYLPEPLAAPHVAQGRFVALLDDWCGGTMPGVFLYYPSRRQMPVPLKVFIEFIKKCRKRGIEREERMKASTSTVLAGTRTNDAIGTLTSVNKAEPSARAVPSPLQPTS